MSISPEQRSEIVQLRIDDALQALDDAGILLARHSLRGAANRIYYAMYYAASALALANQVAFKTHAGLIGFFQREFVARAILGREHGRALQKAFDDRSEADYEDLLDFDDGQLQTRLEEAGRFVSAIEAHLGQRQKGKKM